MHKIALLFLATLVLAACGNSEPPAAKGPELVVYSSRIEQLIKPIFDDFTKETGISIRYVTDEAGPLLARLKAEGENSPADMLITVDAGNLWHAADMGILHAVQSETLSVNIPPALRDEQGRWFGVSIRARTIVYATDRVKPEELAGYEDLADEKWSGRLCLRTSKKVYNQSLVASMISAFGEEKAEQIVGAWVNNLAVPPFSNDVKVVEAIEAGHKENALRLLEWLSGPSAQYDFAHLNQEYPVNDKTAPSELINQWGSFRADTMPLSEAGRLQGDAIKLMDRAGYR
mgnify:CR=1 FL=1